MINIYWCYPSGRHCPLPILLHLILRTFFLCFKVYFIDYDISCPIFLSPLFPSTLQPPSHLHSPHLVHVHGSYM